MSKKLEKILLLIIKAVLGLTLFIPFIISKNTLFPFVFGKAIAFQILVEIILFFYLILILINAKYRPQLGFKRDNLIFWTVSLYILMLLIATLTSQDILLSFWGTQERMTGVFSLLHFFAYFIILIGVLQTKKDWLNLLRVNALVIFIFGIHLLIKTKFLTLIADRYQGTFGNPDIIGSYLLLALFLIIVLWMVDKECRQGKILSQTAQNHQIEQKRCMTLTSDKCKKIIWKIFYSLSFIFAFLGLILSGTRAAYVGLFAGFLCFFFLYVFFSPNKYKQDRAGRRLGLTPQLIGGLNSKYYLKILAVLILFLIVGGFLILGVQGKLPSKITQISIVNRLISIPLSLEAVSDNTRILSWQAGMDGFTEKPILGWGPENYSLSFNKYIKSDYFINNYYYANSVQFDKAHNKFFEILAETGLFGLISYLAIFAAAIILLFKKRNKSRELNNNNQFTTQVSERKTTASQKTNLNFLLISLLLAYFVQNLFTFDTPVSYLLFFLSLGFIAFMTRTGNKSADEIHKSPLPATGQKPRLIGWQFIGLFLLIITIPWLSYIGAIKPYFASRASVIAYAAWQKPKTENLSLSYYQRAIGYHTFASREATYQVCREVIRKASHPDFKFNDYFKEYTQLCLENIELRINKKIFHFEEVLLIGKLYSLLSRWDSSYLDKAETVLKQAMLATPLRSQIYSDLGLILLQKQNYTEALSNFNKALELKGNEPYNYWQIALVYLGQQNFQAALEFIEKAKIAGYNYNNLEDLSTIGFIYSQLADWEQALVYYQNALNLDPKNIEILGSLSLVYKEKGDTQAARSAAEKILEIAPGIKEEIEKFLRDLE